MAKEPQNPDLPDQDGTTLESLFERHYRGVVYFFLRAGVSPEEARDLAQETFLRAHRFWNQFRGDSSHSTWLSEIARNIFKNWLRDRSASKRAAVLVSIDGKSAENESEELPTLDLEAPELRADFALLLKERADQLQQAIQQLPGQQRNCVKLLLKDFRYREIAISMGLSIETVKSHLFQARDSLKKALGGSV